MSTENNYLNTLRPPRLSTTFGSEETSLITAANKGRIKIGESYSTEGALETGDSGNAKWKCVSYGSIPTANGQTLYIDGRCCSVGNKADVLTTLQGAIAE